MSDIRFLRKMSDKIYYLFSQSVERSSLCDVFHDGRSWSKRHNPTRHDLSKMPSDLCLGENDDQSAYSTSSPLQLREKRDLEAWQAKVQQADPSKQQRSKLLFSIIAP